MGFNDDSFRGKKRTYWNLSVSGTTPMMVSAVKTMRKKLRKWSNISVKKYHHRPTFGVRSGTVSLQSVCIEYRK